MVKPPSTPISIPVTNFEASLNNHIKAPVNSSGLPNLLKGVFLIIKFTLSVKLPSSLVNKFLFCNFIRPDTLRLLRHGTALLIM